MPVPWALCHVGVFHEFIFAQKSEMFVYNSLTNYTIRKIKVDFFNQKKIIIGSDYNLICDKTS